MHAVQCFAPTCHTMHMGGESQHQRISRTDQCFHLCCGRYPFQGLHCKPHTLCNPGIQWVDSSCDFGVVSYTVLPYEYFKFKCSLHTVERLSWNLNAMSQIGIHPTSGLAEHELQHRGRIYDNTAIQASVHVKSGVKKWFWPW